ncbi:YecA family protein [Aliivibrio kagoshimensis]|jgi:uncharacterized protein YgfB (UPF0149 family)|uniref:YecA/YgfB family protein n=1 Tax=Aliivibrio kagoshimensis TaxID=2910230 RepID=UPI003D0CE3A2
MTDKKLPEYSAVENALNSSGLAVSSAELHGLLVGMLSGGLNIDDQSWKPALFDYTNDGLGWPDSALQVASSMFTFSVEELTENDLVVTLLLPDDSVPLIELGDAVSDWVTHFLSGLGLAGLSMNDCSTEVKESLTDLEEIARLGIDEDDDLDEQAALLVQVIEHVKACVLTIHTELGARSKPKASKTIH